QPFLENETIGDYYFKIHKANRNEYSRIFFTSMILFAAPSIPFIGALIALFSDRTPFLIIVFLFLFLLEVMGIVFYLMLKTHKKRSEYVFGFHYIRLVMGYEWEGIK
ncbi:MAG: hypothetical protein KAH16_04295, partial [Candidatus Izimaplasma sp.]|nr:hypothetical protein [Candidatus Izimaplasma bacterium]